MSVFAGRGIGDGGPALDAVLCWPGALAVRSVATTTVSWRVVYRFDGFIDPVSNPPTDNFVTARRAIPVKFSLGGDRGTNVVAAGLPSSGSRSCSSPASVDVVDDTVPPGNSRLSYKGWVGTYRQLTLRLNDGSDHVLLFRFR